MSSISYDNSLISETSHTVRSEGHGNITQPSVWQVLGLPSIQPFCSIKLLLMLNTLSHYHVHCYYIRELQFVLSLPLDTKMINANDVNIVVCVDWWITMNIQTHTHSRYTAGNKEFWKNQSTKNKFLPQVNSAWWYIWRNMYGWLHYFSPSSSHDIITFQKISRFFLDESVFLSSIVRGTSSMPLNLIQI